MQYKEKKTTQYLIALERSCFLSAKNKGLILQTSLKSSKLRYRKHNLRSIKILRLPELQTIYGLIWEEGQRVIPRCLFKGTKVSCQQFFWIAPCWHTGRRRGNRETVGVNIWPPSCKRLGHLCHLQGGHTEPDSMQQPRDCSSASARLHEGRDPSVPWLPAEPHLPGSITLVPWEACATPVWIKAPIYPYHNIQRRKTR